jgi:hypothetical protein
MVDLNLAMEIANGNANGMATTTEAGIMVEGHPSIHTNFVSLINGKNTMSLSAEKLHEEKMATMAATMAMEMATTVTQPSFLYFANTINHIVNCCAGRIQAVTEVVTDV